MTKSEYKNESKGVKLTVTHEHFVYDSITANYVEYELYVVIIRN